MSSHTPSFSQIPLEAEMFTESQASFAYLVIYHFNKDVPKEITSTLYNNFISEKQPSDVSVITVGKLNHALLNYNVSHTNVSTVLLFQKL